MIYCDSFPGKNQWKDGKSEESDPTDAWANMLADILVDTLLMHLLRCQPTHH